MLDQEDEGTRIGVWVALGVVFFVLVGVIGGLVLRHMKDSRAAAAPMAAAAPAAVAVEEFVLVEGPLAGDLVATLYFEVAKAELPADAQAKLAEAVKALAAAPARSVVISGFHDASGDPAKNAELAKQRAIAVHGALAQAGATAGKLKLRKPESTTGDGSNQEARRVEIRLVD